MRPKFVFRGWKTEIGGEGKTNIRKWSSRYFRAVILKVWSPDHSISITWESQQVLRPLPQITRTEDVLGESRNLHLNNSRRSFGCKFENCCFREGRARHTTTSDGVKVLFGKGCGDVKRPNARCCNNLIYSKDSLEDCSK